MADNQKCLGLLLMLVGAVDILKLMTITEVKESLWNYPMDQYTAIDVLQCGRVIMKCGVARSLSIYEPPLHIVVDSYYPRDSADGILQHTLVMSVITAAPSFERKVYLAVHGSLGPALS